MSSEWIVEPQRLETDDPQELYNECSRALLEISKLMDELAEEDLDAVLFVAVRANKGNVTVTGAGHMEDALEQAALAILEAHAKEQDDALDA